MFLHPFVCTHTHTHTHMHTCTTHTHTRTQSEDIHEYIDEIIFYIRDQFVDGKASTAKNLIMDSVIVTQNRHCIAMLDKVSYGEPREGGSECPYVRGSKVNGIGCENRL